MKLNSKGKYVLLVLAAAVSLTGLYLLSRVNYLLFHSAVEVFSIVITFAIFAIAWNSRRMMDSSYLLFIGIACLFVGGVDLLHTLAYTGMGVFPEYGANLPTQLWIARASDYGLYWFDYKAGYDVLLAQLGWNYSRQLNIALCRGAATMQKKEWGVIIAWTYTNPPYIESEGEFYNDLVLAYENGANYIVVFDSNENYTQGILDEDHLAALKQFWEYMQDNPRENSATSDRVAYVLPKDYGYGFRGPNDRI